MLVMQLLNPQLITPGRLGRRTMPAGYYCYVGSAFGPGGLRARLRHHASSAARPHWHIDYLRHHAVLIEIWYTDAAQRREHSYADLLSAQPDVSQPVEGFGASDCGCHSHLFHQASRPGIGLFRRQLAEYCPDDALFRVTVR